MCEKLFELEQQYCSQGDISGKRNPKKYFVEAEGCFLFDEEGVAHLDMQMFNSAANFGYRHPVFQERLISQASKMPGLASEFMSENRVLLSWKICDYMQKKHGVKGRVHFDVGGASAVEDAIKLVANYKKTKNVFTFEGSYHGRTIAASSISSSHRYSRQFGANVHTYRVPYPNCQGCAYSMKSESCGMYCLRQFERLFESEFYGVYDTSAKKCNYAAFIIEPVLGRGGYVLPPKNYFKELKKILDKHDVLLVADEIQMGFFRTGELWSFEHFDVVPDIIIFGKSISNGLWPLSGLWAREDIIDPLLWPTGSSHATFAGHPIATSLGLAAFDVMSEDGFHDKVKKSSETFHSIMHGLKRDIKLIDRLDIKGHAAGIDIISENMKPAPKMTAKISEIALNTHVVVEGKKYALILTQGGVFNSSFMLSPSIFINESELELFNLLFRNCIRLAKST